MQRPMRIWVIGAGSVGSVLAGILDRGEPGSATLAGSHDHWMAVRDHGLILEFAGGQTHSLRIPTCTLGDLPELESRDLVLLAGKLRSLEAAAAVLRGRMTHGTQVIALQNGIGIAEHASQLLEQPVSRGLIHFGAACLRPGHVRYYPGMVRVDSSAAGARLASRLQGADLPCNIVGDIAPAEWLKLAINCLANPLAGLLGLTNAAIGQAVLDPAKEAILAEVRAVARAAGRPLTLTVDRFNRICQGPTGENVPSLRVDLERGEASEIDFINGAVVRRGRDHRIPTPVNELLVSLIKSLEGGRLRP